MNIILLNGPSLAKATIPKSGTYFAINRKNLIEKDILKHNIDAWVVCSPPEAIDMVEDIYEFLSRPEDNRFITSTVALNAIRHHLEAKPIPNAHRVILVDCVALTMHQDHQPEIISLYQASGRWNTLSVLLCYLSIESNHPSYLFGCDGCPSDSKDVYFNQAELSPERLGGSNIYADMKFFDDNFWNFMEKHKFKINVFNTNFASFYKSIPFKTLNSCIKRELPKTLNYSAKDLFEKTQQFKPHSLQSWLQNVELVQKINWIHTNLSRARLFLFRKKIK